VGAALIVHVAAVRRELVRPIERLGVLAALVDEPGDLIPARAAALGAFDPKTSSLPTRSLKMIAASRGHSHLRRRREAYGIAIVHPPPTPVADMSGGANLHY